MKDALRRDDHFGTPILSVYQSWVTSLKSARE